MQSHNAVEILLTGSVKLFTSRIHKLDIILSGPCMVRLIEEYDLVSSWSL